MKTKEDLNALRNEVEALNRKLAELSEQEIAQVVGGTTDEFFKKRQQFDRIMTEYQVDRDVQQVLRPLFKDAFESGDNTKLSAALMSYYEQKRIEVRVVSNVLCILC